MARIPEGEVERLKREVSLERLAAADGVELRRHGSNLLGRCPFHDDKTPSLVITPAKNLWHCMGACQAGGSVIDWVMRARSVSFRHAVEILRGDVLPMRRGRLAVACPGDGHFAVGVRLTSTACFGSQDLSSSWASATASQVKARRSGS